MTGDPRVVLTGASGLVGRSVRACAGPDWTPLTLDGARVDVLDADAVALALDVARAPVLIHLAAFTDVTAAWKQTGDRDGTCYRLNVEGTRNVARACRSTGTYLVHVSTDYVFGGTADGAYDETSEPDPRDWYGMTKYLAEQEVLGSGAPAAIARLASPYGRTTGAPAPDLVVRVIRRLAEGARVAMFADTMITPTYLPDLARCLAALVDRRPTGVLHTVGTTALSPYRLARAVAEAMGLNPGGVVPTRYDDYLAAGNRPYPRRLALCGERTAALLGFGPRTVPQALAELVPLVMDDLADADRPRSRSVG